jgi:protoporphyrinogen oxidase
MDWASQRISGLNPLSAVLSVLRRRKKPRSLVDTFYYPAGGTGLIYETMTEEVRRHGGEVLLRSTPVHFHVQGNRITHVTLRTPEGVTDVSPDAVVSSIPITECVHLFGDAASLEVREAAKKLTFRSQAYLFLTLNKERATPDNWIYFPDAEIPFGRIAEMKNFSPIMCPPGKTSLFIEFFCFENDEVWHMSKDDLLAMTLPWLQKLGIASPSEVTSVHHLREPHVYPLYNLSYRTYASQILSWMDRFENFYAIGRPGRFRYTNQDHSLEMGILAARSIIEGRRHDLDQVAQSREYFEKGFVPNLSLTEPLLVDVE